jgi:hypothetical protein
MVAEAVQHDEGGGTHLELVCSGSQEVAETADLAELQAEARAAERDFVYSAMKGVLIGMPVGALIWMGMVALAISLADVSWEVLPALGMGAAVGVFAGAFLGGWVGVTAKAEHLEEAELRIVRRH